MLQSTGILPTTYYNKLGSKPPIMIIASKK